MNLLWLMNQPEDWWNDLPNQVTFKAFLNPYRIITYFEITTHDNFPIPNGIYYVSSKCKPLFPFLDHSHPHS